MMFEINSRLKIGYSVEYAYDMEDKTPFEMILVNDVTDYVALLTNGGLDTLTVTADTRILTARGTWKRISELKQGELLKHNPYNVEVLNIVPLTSPVNMYKVDNTDYVVVNGFYIEG